MVTGNGKRDYYEVLGVGRNASEEEIRRAFRRLALQYHPDRNREPGAEDRFKEINEAYEVLSDGEKRHAYDRFGHAGADAAAAGRGFDTFDGVGGFGDIFEAFFGSARTRRGPERGNDLRMRLTLTFEEAVFGRQKEIEVPHQETCGRCNGSGAEPGTKRSTCDVCSGSGEVRRVQQSLFGHFVNVATCTRCKGEGHIISSPCTQCRGAGRQRATKRLRVTVPAGVNDGAQIRLTGEGDAGPHGGVPGNLYLVVSVQPHEVFRREDDNIFYELSLNVAQATLGDEVTIPTLEGPTTLKVPAGTQNDAVFRQRGKGVPRLQSSGRGDMIIVARVDVPEHLTEQQRRLFQELARTFGGEDARNGDHPEDKDREKGLFDKLKDVLGG